MPPTLLRPLFLLLMAAPGWAFGGVAVGPVEETPGPDGWVGEPSKTFGDAFEVPIPERPASWATLSPSSNAPSLATAVRKVAEPEAGASPMAAPADASGIQVDQVRKLEIPVLGDIGIALLVAAVAAAGLWSVRRKAP